MSKELAELKEHLATLREQEAQHARNVEQVRTKLADADRRRRTDTENQRRWNHVLNNLESCLDDAKARLEMCRLSIRRTENEMDLLREKAEREARTAWLAPDPDVAAMLPDLSGEAMQAARKILETPLEDIGKLSLEEVASLHNQVAEDNFEAALADTDRLLGRLEFANQTTSEPPPRAAGSGPPVDKEQEQRRQQILRMALEKIRTGKLEGMTLEEIRLTITCYDLLTRRLTSSPRDERLKRILGAAVKVLQRRLIEMRREQQEQAKTLNGSA